MKASNVFYKHINKTTINEQNNYINNSTIIYIGSSLELRPSMAGWVWLESLRGLTSWNALLCGFPNDENGREDGGELSRGGPNRVNPTWGVVSEGVH